jgi:hypothetical protein
MRWTLASVLAQDLNDPTTLPKRKFIPLEVPPSVIKHGAQLVTL